MVTSTYNSSRSHGGNNFVLQVGVFPSLSLFFLLFCRVVDNYDLFAVWLFTAKDNDNV